MSAAYAREYRDEPAEVELYDLCRELNDYLTLGEPCGYAAHTGPSLYSQNGRVIGRRRDSQERDHYKLRGAEPPKWLPVRRLTGGRDAEGKARKRDCTVSVDTTIAHVEGRSTVAYRSPSKSLVACVDVDCHLSPAERSDPKVVEARYADRDQRLAYVVAILRSMGIEPVVLRSPGDGYHVWFLLDRAVERGELRRQLRVVLTEGGYSMDQTDLFPQAKALRVPCGPDQIVIDPDTLEPVPGAACGSRRDKLGGLRAFMDRFRKAVLPADELARRASPPPTVSLPADERRPKRSARRCHERKNDGLEQHGPFSGRGCVRYGEEYTDYVHALLARGCWQAGMRWDAMMTLAFAWMVIDEMPREDTRNALLAWIHGHNHVSNQPTEFEGQCMRDFESYAGHLEEGIAEGRLSGGLGSASTRNRYDGDLMEALASLRSHWGWGLDWEACLRRWVERLEVHDGRVTSICRRPPSTGPRTGHDAFTIGGRTSYTVRPRTASGKRKRSFVSWAVMDRLIEIGVLTKVGEHRPGVHGTKYRVDLRAIDRYLAAQCTCEAAVETPAAAATVEATAAEEPAAAATVEEPTAAEVSLVVVTAPTAVPGPTAAGSDAPDAVHEVGQAGVSAAEEIPSEPVDATGSPQASRASTQRRLWSVPESPRPELPRSLPEVEHTCDTSSLATAPVVAVGCDICPSWWSRPAEFDAHLDIALSRYPISVRREAQRWAANRRSYQDVEVARASAIRDVERIHGRNHPLGFDDSWL